MIDDGDLRTLITDNKIFIQKHASLFSTLNEMGKLESSLLRDSQTPFCLDQDITKSKMNKIVLGAISRVQNSVRPARYLVNYVPQVERQIALFFSLLAPRRTVQFFCLSARCKRGESRRTRFEIPQGLVRQLNGIDFASILVVLYSRLPTRLPVLCLTRLANAYVYSFSVKPDTSPSFIFRTGMREKSRKTKNLRNNPAWESKARLMNLFFLALLIRQWYSFSHKF